MRNGVAVPAASRRVGQGWHGWRTPTPWTPTSPTHRYLRGQGGGGGLRQAVPIYATLFQEGTAGDDEDGTTPTPARRRRRTLLNHEEGSGGYDYGYYGSDYVYEPWSGDYYGEYDAEMAQTGRVGINAPVQYFRYDGDSPQSAFMSAVYDYASDEVRATDWLTDCMSGVREQLHPPLLEHGPEVAHRGDSPRALSAC